MIIVSVIGNRSEWSKRGSDRAPQPAHLHHGAHAAAHADALARAALRSLWIRIDWLDGPVAVDQATTVAVTFWYPWAPSGTILVASAGCDWPVFDVARGIRTNSPAWGGVHVYRQRDQVMSVPG